MSAAESALIRWTARPRHAVLLALLIAAVVGLHVQGCGGDNPVRPGEDVYSLRYNEVMFKQTHNSFARSQDWVQSLDFDPMRPYYGGVSGLEFDLLPNYNIVNGFSWGWEIGHATVDMAHWPPTVDPVKYGTFAQTLKKLEDWHKKNPGHRVITVQLELKNVDGLPDGAICWDPPFLPKQCLEAAEFPSSYRRDLPDKLDKYIRDNFDESLLYTPGDLMGGSGDLVAAAQAGGWPTLDELRGKFIFVLHGQRSNGDHGPAEYYSANPKERLCFESFAGNRPDAAHGNKVFWRLGTGSLGNFQEKARWAAGQPGFITRGWPESGDFFAEDKHDDGEHWASACMNGVNVLATNQSRGEWAMVGQEPFWPSPRTFWAGSERMANCSSTSSPAAVEFQGRLYVVYDKNHSLKYVTRDGSTWNVEQSIPGPSSDRPALAVFQDKLWVISRGNQDDKLYYRTFDGTTWSEPALIGGAAHGAGAVVFDKKLYIAYPNTSQGLELRSWTGSDWSRPESLPGLTRYAPAVFVNDGKLRVLHHGKNDDTRIFMLSLVEGRWSETIVSSINGARTGRAPAAANVDGRTQVAIRGAGSASLWFFELNQRGLLSGQGKFDSNLATDGEVALAVYNGDVFMVWKGEGSNDNLYFSRRSIQ